MPAHTQSDPEPSLHYRAEFRLRWEPLPGHQRLSRVDAGNNLSVLRKLISLQRSIIDKQEAGADLRADMQLLDNKLNMALDLLGDLYQALHQLPSHVPVDLCSSAIAWSTTEPPDPGIRLSLELYLSDHYPRPLIFTVQVSSLEAQGATHRVHAGFEGMDDATRDELERLIFLLHRQSVARARQS